METISRGEKFTYFGSLSETTRRKSYIRLLVGLFEGDGYFTITKKKKGKYITYELGIELSIFFRHTINL